MRPITVFSTSVTPSQASRRSQGAVVVLVAEKDYETASCSRPARAGVSLPRKNLYREQSQKPLLRTVFCARAPGAAPGLGLYR
jgi:hypothetical protein